MAEKKVFAVFDVKSDLYGTPFFMNSQGEAVRAFKDAANDDGTMVGKHPADFKLCWISTFDDETAKFSEVFPVVSLGFALDYVNLGKSIPLGVRKEA